jgi:hypothetical protein
MRSLIWRSASAYLSAHGAERYPVASGEGSGVASDSFLHVLPHKKSAPKGALFSLAAVVPKDLLLLDALGLQTKPERR